MLIVLGYLKKLERQNAGVRLFVFSIMKPTNIICKIMYETCTYYNNHYKYHR